MRSGARVMERSEMYREHKASAEIEIMIEVDGSLDTATKNVAYSRTRVPKVFEFFLATARKSIEKTEDES